MTSHLRPLLLTLTLPLLACDGQAEADHPFRSQSGASDVADSVVTLQYDADLPPARVMSYQLGVALEDALAQADLDLLLDGAGEALDEGLLAVRLEGVHPIGGPSFSDGTIVLRRDGQAAETPIAASRFGMAIDPIGAATTEVVFAAASTADADSGDVDGADFVLWQDNLGAPPAPAAAVASIQYELVGADGSTTVCTAAIADLTDPIEIGYRPDGVDRAHLQVTLAPDCVEVLEAAAASGDAEAFFVRCDPTTTTATAIPGVHKVSDVTLKRGILHATGVPAEAFGG